MTGSLPPEPHADPGPVAGWWRRIGALLIDGLVLVGPVFVVLVVSGVDVDLETGELAEGSPSTAAIAVVVLLVLAYNTTLVSARGATIGKASMGLRVVPLDDGSIPAWDRALIRALVPQGAGALPVVGVPLLAACYALALFDRRRRGVHDLAAGTMVITARRCAGRGGWDLDADRLEGEGGRDRRRSGDLPLFRRTLCQLSYPTAVSTGFEPATSGLTGRRTLQTVLRDQ